MQLCQSPAGSEFATVLFNVCGVDQIHMSRVGQNRMNAPYMTVYLVISLPKIPCILVVYTTSIWFWPTLHMSNCNILVVKLHIILSIYIKSSPVFNTHALFHKRESAKCRRIVHYICGR